MGKKVLAVHLPAFHEIPENNKWWVMVLQSGLM